MAAMNATEAPTNMRLLRHRLLIPVAATVALLLTWMAFAPLSGAVVAPAQIVRSPEAHLMVEARIRPQDISHVQKNASAQVRLTSFDARTSPLLIGNVTSVSADRFSCSVTPEAWFPATGEIDQAHLKVPTQI